MPEFRLMIQRADPPFAYVFHGSIEPESQEAQVTAMLAAMREGLEANGYEADVSVEYTTRVTL